MDELIYELIELMKQTAPELWGIAQRQVVVRTVQVFVGLIFSTTILYALYLAIKKLRTWSKSDDFDDGNFSDDDLNLNIGYTIAGLALAFVFFWFMYGIDNIIGLLINPEYYAIQEIIKLVK